MVDKSTETIESEHREVACGPAAAVMLISILLLKHCLRKVARLLNWILPLVSLSHVLVLIMALIRI